MASLSVRGVDDDLAKALKRRAKESDKSVNQIVVEILRKAVGLEKEKKFTEVHTDLDHLFGLWSEEEFNEIQGEIDAGRRIDKELWR
ncbi:MAG: antitoxin [Candidatus Omnitrophica bacterium]|nr:antitoxin [Candidatus Omnitrophota bacterium]MCA9424787.1 antitoxin [Candidatus Omnitrophota bacterium]MCA9436277.1 antitoxin [Candidatus Omnitrophota bacterium]MCA9446391.1 antitoxin [Candidatus Omnitrophota bacterium]MCB9769489.1 antitoxin [Candidatus Omnitrophota bacterium]